MLRLIEADQWHALHELDQLQREMAAHRVLYGFVEGPLNFPPTYKYTRHAAAPMRRRAFPKFSKSHALLHSRPSFPRIPGKDSASPAAGSNGKEAASPMATSNGKERPPIIGHGGSGGFTSPAPQGASSSSEGGGGGGGGGLDGSPNGVLIRRAYDEEKQRVPSWCDRVLCRSLPGPYPLDITSTDHCDDLQFYGSDHAPLATSFEFDVPVLPDSLPLHHCTVYLTNLALYRNRPLTKMDTYTHQNLTARSAQGKGVPLPVAGNKLQNLPPQLSVYAHMLVLHKLMAEPPPLAAALTQDGKGATNIVIGPMLVQREFLKLQQIQLRICSLSGGKPLELGQAAISLASAASGRPTDFDAVVEHLTVPAGFNLKVRTPKNSEEKRGPARAPSHATPLARDPALISSTALRSLTPPICLSAGHHQRRLHEDARRRRLPRHLAPRPLEDHRRQPPAARQAQRALARRLVQPTRRPPAGELVDQAPRRHGRGQRRRPHAANRLAEHVRKLVTRA